MKKGAKLGAFILLAGSAIAMASCGETKSETAIAVEEASKMTLAELKEKSKAEFEAQPNEKFKVVGLTSALQKVAVSVAAQCDWIKYKTGADGAVGDNDNIDVNNSYKDAALLTALQSADKTYVADYVLAQDARSFATLVDDGILYNYAPADKSAIGLSDEDTNPLKGIHFNKLFWTNTNFEKVNGFKLHNIWQMTTAAKTANKSDAITKVSFQSPETEQINMSFLVSALNPSEQKRIETAYKNYFGTEWTKNNGYESAGAQWLDQFIDTISRWHSSDGTAMKETQLKDDWTAGYVYYGAFAKMKDAVGKKYTVDLNGNGTTNDTGVTVECDGKTYTYNETDLNAMTTVKWDWTIDGFNGFMYCMDSQIINNAKFPYTAALFARVLLEEETYKAAIFNASTPGENGQAGNQYGYYYPGAASSGFNYAKGDWTKEQHKAREINEDFEYLKTVKSSTVNAIVAKVAGKTGTN